MFGMEYVRDTILGFWDITKHFNELVFHVQGFGQIVTAQRSPLNSNEKIANDINYVFLNGTLKLRQ